MLSYLLNEFIFFLIGFSKYLKVRIEIIFIRIKYKINKLNEKNFCTSKKFNLNKINIIIWTGK